MLNRRQLNSSLICGARPYTLSNHSTFTRKTTCPNKKTTQVPSLSETSIPQRNISRDIEYAIIYKWCSSLILSCFYRTRFPSCCTSHRIQPTPHGLLLYIVLAYSVSVSSQDQKDRHARRNLWCNMSLSSDYTGISTMVEFRLHRDQRVEDASLLRRILYTRREKYSELILIIDK